MKIFRTDQIKKLDELTVKDEPVSPADLMERAALRLLQWYLPRFERSDRILIFAGPGNNGGDGLALARLLENNRYRPEVYYIEITENTSAEWQLNLRRLKSLTGVPYIKISSADSFPAILPGDIIIDAIFGSGLTRPVSGLAADIIKLINRARARVISIDIPSGLFGEDNSANDREAIISATHTLSFQFPKLSFMFSENALYLGEWDILPIGLSENAMRSLDTPFTLLGKNEVAPLIAKRKKFDHKGTFGHGILFAGSYGKMGAAILGSSAALRTGIGLITCHVPSCGVTVLQCAVPEAMVRPDINCKHLTVTADTDSFSAVGIGPGIGSEPETQDALQRLLTECKKPMVLDADALNILSANKTWLSLIKEGTILTPHPKEFERLAGKTDNSYSRLMLQLEFSKSNKCIVVLKGAHTSITTPDGKIFFNNTGNPGMATAGSGDTLTGIILSLLAQGYSSENAAIIGVYIHGLAGDSALKQSGYESLIASDIINNLGKAFNNLREF